MTLFKKCLRLSQILDLCISRWKNLIFSDGQRRKIEFLMFLPSSILLEAMKKKLATSSFPRYFYANLPDVLCLWTTKDSFTLKVLKMQLVLRLGNIIQCWICNVHFHSIFLVSAKDKLHFEDLQSEGIFSGPETKFLAIKSWSPEVVSNFIFVCFNQCHFT